jgi:hypothetical protein
MKTLIITIGLLVAMSFNACEQEKVPAEVKSAFSQKYPDAKNADWDMEEDGKWEAEFKMNGEEMSASFDQNGQWLETETAMDRDNLPELVDSTLTGNFESYKVEEVEYLESPEGKGYEIQLKGDGKELEVLIGEDGEILKQKTLEENEEDEEAEESE